jgi:hypothetical protein
LEPHFFLFTLFFASDHDLFVLILHLGLGTLICFLVFLGKCLLRMWKSVPNLLSSSWSSSDSSFAQFFDFSLPSASIVWVLGVLEMDSVSLSAFFFLGFWVSGWVL